MLPKNATAEQIAQHRIELGVPEAPDKYELKLRDGLKVEEADKPVVDAILKLVHPLNLNSEGASKIVDWYYDEVHRRTEDRQAKDAEIAQTTQDVLRTEFGQEYRLNMNLVQGLVSLAPETARAQIAGARLADGTPLLSDPDTVRWLVGMAREINPPTALVPSASGAGVATAIADEIGKIEGWMKAPAGSADYKKYWDDPKVSGPGGRYYQLLQGRDKMTEKAA